MDGKMSAFINPKLSTPRTSIRSAITATDSGRRSARRTIHIGDAESRFQVRYRGLGRPGLATIIKSIFKIGYAMPRFKLRIPTSPAWLRERYQKERAAQQERL